VKEYKLYFLDAAGHIRRSMDLRRPDDREAIAEANIFANEHGLELWEGARKVAEIGTSGGSARSSSS
jgi:hypothetical protein